MLLSYEDEEYNLHGVAETAARGNMAPSRSTINKQNIESTFGECRN